MNQIKIERARAVEKIKPIYDQVQELDAQGKEKEAQALVDNLSDEEYEIYKDIKTADTRKTTLENEQKMIPIFNKVKELDAEGKGDEAQKIVDSLTDDEYKAYTLLKNKLKKPLTEESKYKVGDKTNEKSIISDVVTYAKAIGSDPVTAFDRIFSGQYIRRVDNGAIIVERMPLSESEAVKQKLGSSGNMRLDHTVPLELGGSNSEDNLKLVPFEVWVSYTPVENYLGMKLRTGDITKKEAQQKIKDFKDGKLTADEIIKP